MARQYSHSRLSAFEQCRLKYKYHYVDHIKREEDSIEAFLGSRFHDVMERLYAERAFWKPTAQELKDYFHELWEKNWGDHVFVVRTDRTADDYRQIGLKAIEEYHSRYAPFDQGRVLGTEKRLYANLDSDGEYKVVAWIDRLMEQEDGCYEIHDYKTSGTLPVQEKIDQDRQLALYEIAVRQAWPDVKQVDLVWHYVVFDKEMRSRRTPKQLEELTKDTIALINEIESTEEYPPCESSLCRWCDYQDICPLFAHKLRTDVLPKEEYPREDGVSLVNKLSQLDTKKRELEADLTIVKEEMEGITAAAIDLAMKQGVSRLYGADRELTIKDDILIDYPKSGGPNREEFEKTMQELGIWEGLCTLHGVSLKSYAKKHGWLVSVPPPLSGIVSIEPIKTARLSRRKDVEDELM